MNDAPISELLIQARIKTENHLVYFPDSCWKDCLYTFRSTVAYIIFYQGGPIKHDAHVTLPVPQSSVESDYNAACTAGTYLAHFRMLIHELLYTDPDIFP